MDREEELKNTETAAKNQTGGAQSGFRGAADGGQNAAKTQGGADSGRSAAEHSAEDSKYSAEDVRHSADASQTGDGKMNEEKSGAQTAADDSEAENCGEAADGAQSGVSGGKDEPKAEKGGFFKRRDDKEKAALKEKIAELEDRTRRQMAEFENFRKRSGKEKDQMFAMGERSVVEKILPVVDNFERGLATVPEEEKGSAFANGMEMIYRQLMTQLESIGVKPIEAVGQDFDPNFHNAVMQVESEELETGKVAQELQKGYLYHDTVVRHSMVGVVK